MRTTLRGRRTATQPPLRKANTYDSHECHPNGLLVIQFHRYLVTKPGVCSENLESFFIGVLKKFKCEVVIDSVPSLKVPLRCVRFIDSREPWLMPVKGKTAPFTPASIMNSRRVNVFSEKSIFASGFASMLDLRAANAGHLYTLPATAKIFLFLRSTLTR